jgi:hypothetical protein
VITFQHVNESLQLIKVCARFSFEKYVILGRNIDDLSKGFWKESQKEK